MTGEDAEDGADPGIALSVRTGKVRAYDRAAGNAVITGSAFVLRNGLLTGTVGPRGTSGAYSVSGILARFGEGATPKALVSDGKANILYQVATAPTE
jgi:hypothetical protein